MTRQEQHRRAPVVKSFHETVDKGMVEITNGHGLRIGVVDGRTTLAKLKDTNCTSRDSHSSQVSTPKNTSSHLV